MVTTLNHCNKFFCVFGSFIRRFCWNFFVNIFSSLKTILSVDRVPLKKPLASVKLNMLQARFEKTTSWPTIRFHVEIISNKFYHIWYLVDLFIYLDIFFLFYKGISSKASSRTVFVAELVWINSAIALLFFSTLIKSNHPNTNFFNFPLHCLL